MQVYGGDEIGVTKPRRGGCRAAAMGAGGRVLVHIASSAVFSYRHRERLVALGHTINVEKGWTRSAPAASPAV